MSQESLVEKLAKANRDVNKLCEFFAARKGWDLAHNAQDAARDLTSAASTLGDHLLALIARNDSQPASHALPDVDLLPTGELEKARLERFAIFLHDLDTWLSAQSCPTDSPEGLDELQGMEANLACIAELVEAISSIPEPSTAPGYPADDTAGREDPAEPAPETAMTGPDDAPLQLILDDTDERPLVQEFQKMKELTEDCQKMVDEFLAAWGLEFSYIKRKKLFERLLRWITSAPEGHVLVMKMKTAEEPFEPYPSYVSREVLAGKPPSNDP